MIQPRLQPALHCTVCKIGNQYGEAEQEAVGEPGFRDRCATACQPPSHCEPLRDDQEAREKQDLLGVGVLLRWGPFKVRKWVQPVLFFCSTALEWKDCLDKDTTGLAFWGH